MNCDLSPRAKFNCFIFLFAFLSGIFVGSSQLKTKQPCTEVVADDGMEKMLELPTE
jgi:hypothetical protein